MALCGVVLVATSLFASGTAGAAEGDDDTTVTTVADSTTTVVEVPDTPVAEEPTTTVAEETTTTVAPGPASVNLVTGNIITVDKTPLPFDGACNPFAGGQLTYVTRSTPESYQLVISSATTPCTPIDATAVAYKMPATASTAGGQWPQTLVERQVFSITEASDTTVTFAKACDPLQFDVLAGNSPDNSPEKISLLPPVLHGALLFPGDVTTSQQYFPPASCNPPVVAPEVVTNASKEPAPANSATVSPASLALTGSSSTPLALAGGLLLLSGAAMFAWSRRGRRDVD